MRSKLFVSLGALCFPISIFAQQEKKPNVVLFMVDDMGYECLSSNGGLDYTTPNIDQLANQGLRFTNCYSQPLSTPTRTKIMTGMFNSTNYDFFEYLSLSERTFGNVMKDAGYKTAVIGKWQLNGLTCEVPNSKNPMRTRDMGFDEHCLWQLTKKRAEGERFANPMIDTNGEAKRHGIDVYGPDVFCDYGVDFIKRNSGNPFFIYYPMALVHDPFYPTPDSDEWSDKSLREKGNPKFYVDMVEYMDKIVGKMIQTLKDEGVYDNTIIIFLTDNGTGRQITSNTPNGPIKGAKGTTIKHGHHSPLIISWKEKIAPKRTYEHIVSIADIYPTLAELVDDGSKCDGVSLLPILEGSNKPVQEAITIHYDSRHNPMRSRYAMTTEYKLYVTGEFYHFSKDLYEKNPLDVVTLKAKERRVYKLLEDKLAALPKWDPNVRPGRLPKETVERIIKEKNLR